MLLVFRFDKISFSHAININPYRCCSVRVLRCLFFMNASFENLVSHATWVTESVSNIHRTEVNMYGKQVKFVKHIEGTPDAVSTRVTLSFNFFLYRFLGFVCILLCRFFHNYIYIVFVGKGLFQCFPSTTAVDLLAVSVVLPVVPHWRRRRYPFDREGL